MRIYIATALSNVGFAAVWAHRFNRGGHVVVSSWIDAVGAHAVDPDDRVTRAGILETNLGDLHLADVVFAFTPDTKGKATYGEIGYALARGIRVLWLAPDGGVGANVFDSHSLVTRIEDPSRVMSDLRRIELNTLDTAPEIETSTNVEWA